MGNFLTKHLCIGPIADPSDAGFVAVSAAPCLFFGKSMKIKQDVNQKKGHSRLLGGRSGFSLIEMLVVVFIVGLFAAGLLGGLSVALKRSKEQKTQAAMGSAIAMANSIEKKTAIKPDHRMANYFWIDTDLTSTTAPNPATSRRMSSAEFFVFLCSLDEQAGTQLETLGGKFLLPALGKDGADLPPANSGRVLVFEQAPNFSMVTTGSTATSASKGKSEAIQTNDTLYAAQPYRLMSPSGGWRLRSLFDGWGRELAYRFFADRSELNAAANTSEDVAGDEQTVPPLEGKADGPVRPAVAEYAFPYFMSAGADGKWGAFIDGTNPDFARNAVADKKTARDAGAMDNLYSQEASR